MSTICKIEAREILDSRGNPTVFVRVFTSSGASGAACVPSGASTGSHEALELRDGDKKRFLGKGVLKACGNVMGPIAKALIGKCVCNQAEIDNTMIALDGTETKSVLGANAILGVSLACARAAANVRNIPLYAHIGGINAHRLPCPMLNIINGGAHADSGLEFQEFMIRPHGFENFSTALRAATEVFHTLKSILKKKGYNTSVGDEGGFAPNFSSHEEACEYIVEAIQTAGYAPGKQISIALDCANTELFVADSKKYVEKKSKAHKAWTGEEMIAYLKTLAARFPIDSIEDGLGEEDWSSWQKLTTELGNIQLVGDDIFVTNPKFLARGIREKVGNAILIKVNQIGTLTETLHTIQLAQRNNFKTVISHRSGETEDSFIADLAVATNAGQIKTGAPSRSDRVAKYNRLLEIEHELGSGACF